MVPFSFPKSVSNLNQLSSEIVSQPNAASSSVVSASIQASVEKNVIVKQKDVTSSSNLSLKKRQRYSVLGSRNSNDTGCIMQPSTSPDNQGKGTLTGLLNLPEDLYRQLIKQLDFSDVFNLEVLVNSELRKQTILGQLFNAIEEKKVNNLPDIGRFLEAFEHTFTPEKLAPDLNLQPSKSALAFIAVVKKLLAFHRVLPQGQKKALAHYINELLHEEPIFCENGKLSSIVSVILRDPDILICLSSLNDSVNFFKNRFGNLNCLLDRCLKFQEAFRDTNNYSIRSRMDQDCFKNHFDYALFVVKKFGSFYPRLNDRLKQHPDIVHAAISSRGGVYQHIPDSFKNDRGLALIAVSQHASSFEFISDELKHDKEIVEIAVSRDGTVLRFLPDHYKNDRNMVMLAVSNNGLALNYAPEVFKNDKEIALAAVDQAGVTALRYVGLELQGDSEVQDRANARLQIILDGLSQTPLMNSSMRFL